MLPRIIFDVKNHVCHHCVCRKCVSHNFVFWFISNNKRIVANFKIGNQLFWKNVRDIGIEPRVNFRSTDFESAAFTNFANPAFLVVCLCWTSGIRTHNTWVKVKCINHYTMVQCFNVIKSFLMRVCDVIRTHNLVFEQQILSLLSIPVPSHRQIINAVHHARVWTLRDLNSRPCDYESPALTIWAKGPNCQTSRIRN